MRLSKIAQQARFKRSPTLKSYTNMQENNTAKNSTYYENITPKTPILSKFKLKFVLHF